MKSITKLNIPVLIFASLLPSANSCEFNFGTQPYEQPGTDGGDDVDDYTPGRDWELIWSDEFDGAELNRDVWTRQNLPSPYNAEWERYTPSETHSYVENSCLVIKATHDSGTVAPGQYTSARVISNPGGGTGTSGNTGKTFRYGKIAARIKLPSGKGIWPAFWMLGDNVNETGGSTPWPASGEIDILETGSKDAGDNYWGHATAGQAIHFSNGDGNWAYRSGSKGLKYGMYSDGYHVFEIEWDAAKIVWKIDGAWVHNETITDSWLSEFHNDFYVIFNIAVGGNYTFAPDESTSFPQYMYVDWIRHYEKS